MANDQDQLRQQLDQIIQAIGFGIVSDYRELRQSIESLDKSGREKLSSVRDIETDMQGMGRSLDRLQQDLYRQRESRSFKQAEDTLERRNRSAIAGNDSNLRKILATVAALKAQISDAERVDKQDTGGDDTDNASLPPGSRPPPGGGGGAGGGGGGTGALGAAVETAAVLGAADVTAKALKGGARGAESVVPASAGVANVGADLARPAEAAATGAGGKGALAGAKQAITGTIKTSTQRAMAKVASKLPSWLSRNGARMVAAVGAKNVPVFGILVGGYFAFQRFFSGDSWTAIGMEFASGIAPDLGYISAAVTGPAGPVAGIATSIALQTYLICRDIYNEENASDIQAGIVPTFDSLTVSERISVLNSIKNQVSAYITSMITGKKVEMPSSVPASVSSSSTAVAATAAAAAATAQAQGPGEAPVGAVTALPPPPAAAEGPPPAPSSPPAAPAPAAAPGPALPPNYVGSTSPREPAAPTMGAGEPGSPNIGGGTPLTSGVLVPDSGLPIVEILETGPGYNKVRLSDGSIVKRTGDRNWRNNNPGNIEYGDFTRNRGAIGTDGRFAIFPDVATGRAAKQALLFEGKNYKDKTIAEAIYRWAPPSDGNPTAAYISQAAAGAGVDANTRLSDLTPEQREMMMNAMARVEGMRPGKTEVLQAGQSQVAAMRDGAVVTPLPSDTPRASVGRDLAPAAGLDMEDTSSTSVQSVNAKARSRVSKSAEKDDSKSSIMEHMEYLKHMQKLAEEMKTHAHGESTADHAFEAAMDPVR